MLSLVMGFTCRLKSQECFAALLIKASLQEQDSSSLMQFIAVLSVPNL